MKKCVHCGQSSCKWIADKDYENMDFDELEQSWLSSQRRVLGGWWVDYIPKCLVDKYHFIDEIYNKRDEKRREVVRA